MIIFTPIILPENQKNYTIPKYDGVKMSLEEFQNWEPEVEPGIKYEWNYGILEAEAKMSINEIKILLNFQKKWRSLNSSSPEGEFFGEVECYFPKINKLKIPDICYLTKSQIRSSDPNNHIPQFVIEVISPSNSALEIERKVRDYFSAGVNCVWTIYPKLKTVKLYNSPKQIKICTDSDLCEALKVLPNFQISVNEIFQDL